MRHGTGCPGLDGQHIPKCCGKLKGPPRNEKKDASKRHISAMPRVAALLAAHGGALRAAVHRHAPPETDAPVGGTKRLKPADPRFPTSDP